MAVFETLFILAGILMGLVSRGGIYLFLLPLAVAAFVLAIMNRPAKQISTTGRTKLITSIVIVLITCIYAFGLFNLIKQDLDETKSDLRKTRELLSNTQTQKSDLHDQKLIQQEQLELSQERSKKLDSTLRQFLLEDSLRNEFQNSLYAHEALAENNDIEHFTVSIDTVQWPFSKVYAHWTLPTKGISKTARNRIIRTLLGDKVQKTDLTLDKPHMQTILKRFADEAHKDQIHRCTDTSDTNINIQERSHAYADTIPMQLVDSIAPIYETKSWATYLLYEREYKDCEAVHWRRNRYMTFSKQDGSVVDRSIFLPGSQKLLTALIRKNAADHAIIDEINQEIQPNLTLFLKDGIGFKYFYIGITDFDRKDGLVVVPYSQILPLIRKDVLKKFGFEK